MYLASRFTCAVCSLDRQKSAFTANARRVSRNPLIHPRVQTLPWYLTIGDRRLSGVMPCPVDFYSPGKHG